MLVWQENQIKVKIRLHLKFQRVSMIRKGILLFLVAFQLTSGEFLKIPKKRQWGQLDQLKQLDQLDQLDQLYQYKYFDGK